MPPEVDREPRNRIPVGMPTYDRDSNRATQLIVLNYPGAPCDEFEVPNTGKTVADFNSDYKPSTPAVQTAYRYALDENVDNWSLHSFDELLPEAQEEEGVKIYTFPAHRLKSATSRLPDEVETHRELVCYQWARMTHLSATIHHTDRFQGPMMWSNYRKRVSGEISISSILKENQYQLKENHGVCTYCNQEAKTTFDHVIASDRNGVDEISNMVPACQSCNSSKSNQNVIDWHQSHERPIDRVVLGKYLKLRWEHFSDEDKLDEPIPEDLYRRWNELEITRRIEQRIKV